MENHLKLMSTTSIKKPFAMKYGVKIGNKEDKTKIAESD